MITPPVSLPLQTQKPCRSSHSHSAQRARPRATGGEPTSERRPQPSRDVIDLRLDGVLDLEQQGRHLWTEPRDLVVRANVLGEGVGVGVSKRLCEVFEKHPLARLLEGGIHRVIPPNRGSRRPSVPGGKVADSRLEPVVLDAPFEKVGLERGRAHLLVDVDGALVVARRRREPCDAQEALVALRRVLFALVVVCGGLEGLHGQR
mmetsp:Transcript_39577/g.130625  ORF Transcript_39577/g.130625 Transcript_39577/m.130625 type:complete len:204 (-) Transcript_39577:461-1072(-)